MMLALLSFLPLQPSGSQALKVTYTDTTTEAGITFKHVASPEKKYIVESMSGGVAFIDYDNDGDLDVYLVNSLTVDLVSDDRSRSSRSLTFTPNCISPKPEGLPSLDS